MQKNSSEMVQSSEEWTNIWNKLSIESEILMWDYFGGRPWVLKYVPRNGKILEAGCGLGRYNFYLSNLGINTIGMDFSVNVITYLNNWTKANGYNIPFIVGDVTSLPFADNELSGYLSFGVVEHFIDGPDVPLKEAFRVLKPGGIAIITTPNHTWSKAILRTNYKIKNVVKKIIGHKINKKGFFQYEYSPLQLKRFLEKTGLEVMESIGTDFLYTFTEYGIYSLIQTDTPPWYFKTSKFIDNSILRILGAQSITVSIKLADQMHCFFCDEMKAGLESLKKFNVPVCKNCESGSLAKFYLKNLKTYFHNDYLVNPPFDDQHERQCEYCGANYTVNQLFENFGFSKNVCGNCMVKPEINIYLANTHLQPVWRTRLNKWSSEK
jgi:ubiquinone/menaquinone biosynthesis C-methylase UbiE